MGEKKVEAKSKTEIVSEVMPTQDNVVWYNGKKGLTRIQLDE